MALASAPINHTHTHTSSHEARGNQSVVLPPGKPPSLLLTAPPPQTPPPPYGMPAAVCLKEALCARRKTHSCAAEPSNTLMTGAQLNNDFRPYHTVIDSHMVWHDYAVIKLNYLFEILNKIGLVKRLDAQLRSWVNTGTVSVLLEMLTLLTFHIF